MKNKCKIIISLIITMLAIALVGCGKSTTENEMPISSCVELLNSVWETFEEEKKFPAMGGSFDASVDNAAGAFDIEDTENLTYMLHVPENSISDIDEAASLIHAMNANTFTGAAFHLTEAADAEEFVTSLKENILNARWMCGIPDKMMIYTINGEYVVAVFGNTDAVETFKTKLVEIYGEGAVLVTEENIA